jgi:hypothetical protein
MAARKYLLGSAMAVWIAGLATAIDVDRSAADAAAHKVGEVTWHPQKFVDREIALVGYVLVREKDYVLFSDEARGKVSAHDLPVTGAGLDGMVTLKKYLIKGRFLDHGFTAGNGSGYHLELTAPPEEAKP